MVVAEPEQPVSSGASSTCIGWWSSEILADES